MLKNSCFLLFILFSYLVNGCESPPPPINIEDNARKFTVKILVKTEDKTSVGTGVIFALSDRTYSVLTVGHNAKLNDSGSGMEVPNPTEEERKSKDISPVKLSIIAPDGKSYLITEENIVRPSNSLDIAILKFKSEKTYQTASFSNNDTITKDSSIYIFGHKGCDNTNDDLELTSGKVVSISNNQTNVYYTNSTVTGMSGSPIMDSKGEIIGIHGYSSRQKDTIESHIKDQCIKIDGNKNLSDNFGVPLQKFRKYLH
jgi:V8-like Glu-specific endopeptidase